MSVLNHKSIKTWFAAVVPPVHPEPEDISSEHASHVSDGDKKIKLI